MHEFGLVWRGFLLNSRPLGCFLLVYFGLVLLLVVVVLVLVAVTGVKQSQLLVPRLKSGLEFDNTVNILKKT